MKTKTKIKRRIKQNFGTIIILGVITMLSVAALINIMFLKPYVDTSKVEHKPKIAVLPVSINKGIIREVTAYNVGDKNQTDSTPCVGASGDDLCQLLETGINICAANFVPLKTKLYVDKFGECLVLDRLNSRYQNRVDIAMKLNEKQRAINFGLQKLLVNNK